ncbi:MAG: LysE family transporter [Anaerolineales bacterium]|jgi:threonine/homoserine/homoserine lactone efflux protein
MAAFWEGVLAGLGVAVPVGAIAILIVDVGLRQGFATAFLAGAGAASADFLYAGLAALAGKALAAALIPIGPGLRIASAMALLLIGGRGLWRARKSQEHRPQIPATLVGQGHFRTYALFLGLTLLNPLTVTYFGALILGREVGIMATIAQRSAFVAGAGLASLAWQTVLAGFGAFARMHLSDRFQRWATIGGNLLVIGLGVRMAIQALR